MPPRGSRHHVRVTLGPTVTHGFLLLESRGWYICKILILLLVFFNNRKKSSDFGKSDDLKRVCFWEKTRNLRKLRVGRAVLACYQTWFSLFCSVSRGKCELLPWKKNCGSVVLFLPVLKGGFSRFFSLQGQMRAAVLKKKWRVGCAVFACSQRWISSIF